ncbi:MAG: HAD-IIIA family hydrolase [Proteobacteria bacterium]|nr:HAD-IIIA family hydrolase [Pseudomonadota bacterium]
MKLVLLAGGKGTRLGLENVPKPMVKIGDKPILEHQIELAKSYGINEIFIMSGHLAHVIYDYFKDGKDFGVKITHITEPYPLGTAGCIKLLENIIRDRFLVFYGDIMINFDIRSFIKFDRKKRGIASIVVHPNNHPYDSDLIETAEDGKVIAIHPKPHQDGFYRNLVNAAVYILSPEIFKYITFGKHVDFGRELFPDLLKKGKEIYAYKTPEYFKDIGTKDRLQKVIEDYEKGKYHIFNKKNKFKAIFLDRDGVINEEVNLLHKHEDLRLIEGSSKAIKKINDSNYLAVVITNQPVIARNLCTLDDLNLIHKKLETLLGNEKAYLDEIYFCPHHPDKGFEGENRAFKIDCECRKPKIGLIKRAVKELKISLNGSYFIGDTERDILCGKNAGLITVALRTGHGCRDMKTKPDYFFENLYEAVNFIIEEPYKNFYENIYKIYKKRENNQFLVLVAGNTRSGKSTFTSYLKQKFNEVGIKTQILSLDDWLLPLEKRTDSMNVLDRFQIKKIENDLKQLFEGKKVNIEPYNTITRGSQKEVSISLNNSAKIIIVEGVVAFNIRYLFKKSDFKIFCKIDDGLLKKRVFNFYRWKGLKDREIEKLYSERKIDEYEIISGNENLADLVIEAKE